MSDSTSNHLYDRAQISDEGVSVLKSLIGYTVGMIYASCIQVAGQHFTAFDFSIPVSHQSDSKWIHRFIVLRCRWFETPKFLDDYWTIQIQNLDRPGDLEYDSPRGIVAPCTVNFYGATPITRIDIYKLERTNSDRENTENICYDKAILFRTADGKSFCFACQLNGPGTANEFHLSEDEETIRGFLNGSTLRHSIQ